MSRVPANLAAVMADVRTRWSLELFDPFVPGGTCSWEAPARRGDTDVVLKIGWPRCGCPGALTAGGIEQDLDDRGIRPEGAWRRAEHPAPAQHRGVRFQSAPQRSHISGSRSRSPPTLFARSQACIARSRVRNISNSSPGICMAG